jgi:hypothetical protein
MAYRIMASDTNKIVLERESTRLAAGVFVVIGSVFFLIGVGLNVFMNTWEMPFVIFRLLFPLFGLIAIVAGVYLPKQTRETQPEQITFDHSKGAVVVSMSKMGDQHGYIRYDEIEDFDIYVESRSTSSSKGPSRTYYRHHVYLKKKDGGEWHLFDYGDRAEADAMIAQLRAQVPSDKQFNVSISPKLSPKIAKQEGLDRTIIHWQNKVTIWAPLFLFVFSVIFLSVLYSFFTFGQEIEVFGLIVIGFIFFVFLLVMFATVRKFIKDATTRYAVSVDHANLEYYEFAKSSGQMRNKKSLPLKQVHSINYNFIPGQNNPAAGLKILTHGESARIQELKEKPLEALKDLFKSNNQPISLSITALNPVECLQLENWLQELILKKGNVNAL